jgi:hypothetical protein
MNIAAYLMDVGRRRKIMLWLLAAVVLAGLIGLGFAAKPVYRMYREYRIDENFAAAKEAALHEDWNTARDKARSVLLARRNDFGAYRIWTRACDKLNEPQAYMAAAQFFGDTRATRDDLLEALRMMVSKAPHALALRAYDSLPKNLRDEAIFRAAIVPLLVRRGEINAAERALREVIRPDDGPEVRLELLRTLCSRPDVKRVAEARWIFAGLIAKGADTQALAAMRLLGEIPGGLSPELSLPDFQVWLKTQPKATTIHHLLAMHPAIEVHPKQADALYQEAITRFLTKDPGVLGNWLVRHGKAELAARVLVAPARTRPDAYLSRLYALLRLGGNTDEIKAALAAPPEAVDPVEMEMVKALLAVRNRDQSAAKASWTRVLNQAAFDTSQNRFIEIARVVSKSGPKDAAEDAWVAAVRLGWGPLPFYRDLLPIMSSLAVKGRTGDLLEMCRVLLRFEPFNADLINNFYYFALLHGIVSPDRIIPVQSDMANQLNKPEYQSTLMLAQILAGRGADALNTLPKFADCKEVEPMMKLALEGCARVLVGETEAGRALLGKVNWTGFMRQERSVFRDVLVKSTIAGLPLPEFKIESVEANPEQAPAWRKALEELQKDRTGEILPKFKKETVDPDPGQTPAWRKLLERFQKDNTGGDLPALPAPRVKGAEPSATPPGKL